jgi:GH24 family phage-related lysozyme (muramidase)
MDIQEDGIILQTAWEGFKSTKYPDGKGYSIGYGTYIDTPKEQYLLNKSITKLEARALLLNDNRTQFIPVIKKYVKVELNQNQFHGLLDLVYNVGPGCLFKDGKTTGLCNAINSRNEAQVIAKIKAYNKVKVRGVITTSTYQTKRRNADVRMWQDGTILYPNTKTKSPSSLGQEISNSNKSISTLQYLGGLLIISGLSIFAYKKGLFKILFKKKG